MYELADRILREAPTEKGLHRRQVALAAALHALECLPQDRHWIHDIPPPVRSPLRHSVLASPGYHFLLLDEACARRFRRQTELSSSELDGLAPLS